MSTAYDVAAWRDLFTMAGGASAALAGLLFVAVSLNLTQVLGLKSLPPLAGQSIGLLVAIVVIAAFGLAPGQSALAFGIEVLAVSAVVAAMVIALTVIGAPGMPRHLWRLRWLAVSVLSVVPGLVGGVSLIVGAGGGVWWVLADVVVAVVVSVYNAWVLLVEIRR